MEKVKFFNEKKFMWDGMTYDSESEALRIKAEYENDKYKTNLIHEEGKYFLFTRRIVTEIVVEH